MSLELKDRVAAILHDEIAPALELDGPSLELVAIDDGIAQIRMGGACSGCPATIHILIMGIERELCARVPEIHYIEAVV